MKHRKLSNKRYGWVLLVISLMLIIVFSGIHYARQNQRELSAQIEALSSSFEQLTSENDQLKEELGAIEVELTARDKLLKSLEDEKNISADLLLEIEKENISLEESLKKEQEETELYIYKNLVRAKDIDASLVIDLKYATEDNFTNSRVYPENAKALLRLETALKLKKANERFEKDGYRIKIWDAYRPISVQEIFWSLVPDPKYVADPAKGSVHNKGASVDITLVDSGGKELLMPTGYDDFSEKSSRNYTGSPSTARENMKYMEKIMNEAGFTGLPSEWWHFDDKSGTYPLLDVDFQAFN